MTPNLATVWYALAVAVTSYILLELRRDIPTATDPKTFSQLAAHFFPAVLEFLCFLGWLAAVVGGIMHIFQ